MDSLLDAGTLLRWLHLVSAALFVGLAAAVDWVVGPALLSRHGAALLPRTGPALMLALRWSGAVAWISGMTYGLGWLARADPSGSWNWLTGNMRGQWVFLAAGLASASIFISWFVVCPCWDHLAHAASSDPEGKDPDHEQRRWRLAAALGARLASALTLPLLFAMGAARHLGETGSGELPTSFGTAAGLVVVVGLAAGLVLGSAANALARRALEHPSP